MKILFAAVSLFLSCLLHAQETIYPSPSVVNNAYLRDDVSNFKFFILRDTMKMAVGTMQTTVSVDKDKGQITYTQKTALGPLKVESLDTVILSTKDFSTIYFSSSTMNEETVLHFKDRFVKGTWNIFSEPKAITDTLQTSFFDYNAIALLIGWLPLKEGKTYEIPAFKFIPGLHGVMSPVLITKVELIKRDNKDVMKVTVREKRKENFRSVYYIEKKTHTLIQVDIDNDGKHSQMIKQPQPSA